MLCDSSSAFPLSGVHLSYSKKFLFTSVSHTFSFWTPSEIYLLAWPLPRPFQNAVTYENKIIFSTLSIYKLKQFPLFLFTILYILNILFRCNTLRTNKSNNNLIITALHSACSLGLMSACRIANVRLQCWQCISEDHLSSQHQDGYVFLTANKSSGKRNKNHIYFLCCGKYGGGETLIQFWFWNILFTQRSVGGPLRIYCGSQIFCRFTVTH